MLVAYLLVNAPNCHLSLVLASIVQGNAVNCNNAAFSMAYERGAHEVHCSRARQLLGLRKDESTHTKSFCNQAQKY